MLASKRKRYLSGPDWVIGTLDCMMKEQTCSGNMSQVVLTLDSVLDEEDLRTRLGNFVRRFPVLSGTVARDFKLSPYWKIPKTGRDIALNIMPDADCSSPAALLPVLIETANSRFKNEQEHLAFHFFSDRKRSALAMTFDHRIFDARGAESFLNLFQQNLNNGSIHGEIVFRSSSELTHWKKKFLSGRSVNRRIIALSKSSPRALQIATGRDKKFKYRLLSFSEQETSRIFEKAYTEAGYLLESPFLLSVVTHVLHDLLKNRKEGESYVIPVTMDLRPGLDPVQEIFFNYVSYLFYQIPIQEADDLKTIINLVKQQMYDQVKAGFPKDLAEASLLTRIAPLPLLGKLLYLPLKGKMATFAFSHLSKSFYQSGEFMGSRVDTVFHMPRVPVPPGLGFFSNVYNGRLSMVISFLDGLLTEGELAMIEHGIRQRFSTGRN